jgi:hypothetical protein
MYATQQRMRVVIHTCQLRYNRSPAADKEDIIALRSSWIVTPTLWVLAVDDDDVDVVDDVVDDVPICCTLDDVAVFDDDDAL